MPRIKKTGTLDRPKEGMQDTYLQCIMIIIRVSFNAPQLRHFLMNTL